MYNETHLVFVEEQVSTGLSRVMRYSLLEHSMDRSAAVKRERIIYSSFVNHSIKTLFHAYMLF